MSKCMTRYPVIALDYKNKHKATDKELVIDYETGNIYIYYNNEMINITKRISDLLENFDGDKITVEIDGEEILLPDIIQKMKEYTKDVVSAVEIGGGENGKPEPVFFGTTYVLDNKTISHIQNVLEINGFTLAPNNSILIKNKEGKLEWIRYDLLGGNSDSGIIGDNSNINSPTDSNKGYVDIIEPVNEKIYLQSGKYQKSLNLNKNCTVVLPRILDDYSEIEWYVKSNSNTPLLRFSNNVIWKDIYNTRLQANSHHIYRFKTWDNGNSWLGTLEIFNQASTEDN